MPQTGILSYITQVAFVKQTGGGTKALRGPLTIWVSELSCLLDGSDAPVCEETDENSAWERGQALGIQFCPRVSLYSNLAK